MVFGLWERHAGRIKITQNIITGHSKSIHFAVVLRDSRKITDIAIFLKTETDTDVGIPKTEKNRTYRKPKIPKTDHKKRNKYIFRFLEITGKSLIDHHT